ncbi:hypothetical protein SAMN05421505_12952 [Sinosporangium album]|uniref:PknH-like extracellular domain-containing protein n=1 Tax=Sinosporangium album TaxID=504805 RepID=A0A1G8GX91_9ACTN|nr:hypothetical protein [Sinosporangium album]SDH98840.1 hypothetical protein SAMN05421505_12952 [Sinosporangium album]
MPINAYKPAYKTIAAMSMLLVAATSCSSSDTPAAPQAGNQSQTPQSTPASTPAPTQTTAGVSESLHPVTPAVTQAATRLGSGLLSTVDGMNKAYGPETGAYGNLTATRRGAEAMAKATMDKPGCAAVGQLDVRAPAVRDAPAAVVAFSSPQRSVTHALIKLRGREAVRRFPRALRPECEVYTVTVDGASTTYHTREVALPSRGDRLRAFLTSADGAGLDLQIGSVALQKGNVVMNLLVVGSKLSRRELSNQTDNAYAALMKVVE